jgi:hypothetical protein
MSDLIIKITQRMRLANYSTTVDRNIRNAHKRAGMELRDEVKNLLNIPGYQIRQKGDVMTSGFVVRRGERVDARDASGRFIKGMGGGEAKSVRARGLVAKKNEINYDVVRSKPGEAPRRQRGTLYMAQTYETIDSPRGITTRVGPSVRVAKSARALELGYEPGGLAPRPYLAPAANAFRPRFVALMADAVRRSS